MCCGCGCGDGCGVCAGNIAYISEKLVSFAAMTAVIVCIVLTVTISIGLGAGLGYNYCYVDLKVISEEPETETRFGLLMRTGEEPFTEEGYRKSMPSSTQPRRIFIPDNQHTMAISLNEDFDFSSLISKLRGRNKNVTLELIA